MVTVLGWVAVALVGTMLWILGAWARKVVGDDLRTRSDRLPTTMIDIAARLLPNEVRDDVHREWVCDAEKLYASTDGLPGERALRSLPFGFHLVLNAYSLRRLYKPRPRPFKPLPLREPLNLGELMFSVMATVVFVGLLLGMVFVAAPHWMPAIAFILAIPGLMMLVILLEGIEDSLNRTTTGSAIEPDPTPGKPQRPETRTNDTVGTDRSTRDEEWEDGAA
ncbi:MULTISPECIES: hypothetical protein [unclassified Rhodococcus (in: high G+C Gram-positive bacteria)]|uniref:hypothetical protein n=1 Tax=unclassified Rhodococcus (in: high G+C Gram-positive bacteria) TaxID=192944 RepID=UPI00117B608A|nr:MULTISPECIES: hypothetical protein [unclassified Rhodococcus (in: high G+C Gram-positive bacteria)]